MRESTITRVFILGKPIGLLQKIEIEHNYASGTLKEVTVDRILDGKGATLSELFTPNGSRRLDLEIQYLDDEQNLIAVHTVSGLRKKNLKVIIDANIKHPIERLVLIANKVEFKRANAI